MTRVLVPPATPCVIRRFDPASDVLVIALPEDRDGGLAHSLAFRYDRKRNTLIVTLVQSASGARFIVLLPGVRRLDPSCVAVLSLSDAQHLRPRPGSGHEAVQSGTRPYPTGNQGPARRDTRPRKMAFVHRHSWYEAGPPAERFFDLSHPESELSVTLADGTGGPIYVIRLTEHASTTAKASETHSSIVIAQSAPGTPHLSTSLLTQWFSTRLGSPDFRTIAWIWLGHEGHFVDPETGHVRPFGAINTAAQFAIRGNIGGSVAIER